MIEAIPEDGNQEDKGVVDESGVYIPHPDQSRRINERYETPDIEFDLRIDITGLTPEEVAQIMLDNLDLPKKNHNMLDC